MPRSNIKKFVGLILALAIVATCTTLGVLTGWMVNWGLAWSLTSADVSLPLWLSAPLIVLLFSGGPIGFIIGIVWARDVLRIN